MAAEGGNAHLTAPQLHSPEMAPAPAPAPAVGMHTICSATLLTRSIGVPDERFNRRRVLVELSRRPYACCYNAAASSLTA